MTPIRQIVTVLLLISPLIKTAQSQKIAGDYLIGAMFPIWSRSERDPNRCAPFINLHGLLMAEEFIYAVQQVNQDPNILSNTSIGFTLRDHCDSKYMAQTATWAFYDAKDKGDKVSSVITHGSFPYEFTQSMAGMLANKDPAVPLLSSSSLPQNSDKKLFDVLEISPSRDRLMQGMVSIMKHFKWDYIIVISMDNDDGNTKLESLQMELAEQYICIAQSYQMKSSADARKTVKEIKSFTANKTINVILLLTPQEISFNLTIQAAAEDMDMTWLASRESWNINKDISVKQLSQIGGLIYVGLEPPLSRKNFIQYLKDTDLSNHPSNPWYTSEYKDQLLGVAHEDEGLVIDAVYAIAHALQMKQNDSACKSLGSYLDSVDFLAPSGRKFSFAHDGTLDQTRYTIFNLQKNSSKTVKYTAIGYVSYSHDEDLQLQVHAKDSDIRWGGKGVPKSYCSAACAPGWYTVRDLHNSMKCCFNCMECPFGEETTEYGASSCDVIPWKQLQALITYGVVGACLLLILLLVILFCRLHTAFEIRYSSNATLHLLCSLILAVLLPVALFLPVDNLYCDVYNGAYVLCLGIPISILISQSKCFRDKVYEQKSETEKSCCVCDPQPAIYIILLFINLAVGGIFIFYFPSDVLTIEYSGKFLNECSSHSNRLFLILFFYILILGSVLFLISIKSLKRDMGEYDTASVCYCVLFFFLLCFFYLYARNNLEGKYKIIALAGINFLHTANFLFIIFIPKLCMLQYHHLNNKPKISFLSPYELSHEQDKVSERLSNTLPRDNLSPLLPQKVIVHDNNCQEKGETTRF